MSHAFAELMNQTITVNASNSRDKYGKRGFASSGTTYADCRIQTENKLVRDLTGREVFETGRVYVLGNCVVSIGDKVTLPSGQTPVVVDVRKVNDESGVHHTVIHLSEQA